jgi:cobalt-zinc-cadmium efflux system outer membrane protein
MTSKSNCGKTSPLEGKKADIAFKMAKLTCNKRFAELQRAKTKLTAFWNCTQTQFGQVDYDLFSIKAPLPFCQLAEELENNPELTRAQAEVAKAWEIIQLEQARRFPDMAIYVGVSTTRNFHDPSLSLGVSIPLPIFDRNQGNIARADLEMNQMMLKQTDLINQLKIRIKIAYREWFTAYQQAADLKEILDTTASEAFKLVEERYELGDCDFLDLLDAKTALFNIRLQYLEAVEVYHHKRAEVMQLLAKCCSDVFNG